MLENQDLRQLYHAAQSKLRALTNKQLEELCKDTYDEVDRREIDAVFAVTSSNAGVGAGAKHCTPFLPVDPRFTSVRWGLNNSGNERVNLLLQKSSTPEARTTIETRILLPHRRLALGNKAPRHFHDAYNVVIAAAFYLVVAFLVERVS